MSNQRRSLQKIAAARGKGFAAVVVELCESHFRRFPDDPFALIWYAMAKRELADYTQAQRAIRRAILLGKGNRRLIGFAFSEMGHLFDAKGNFKAAAAWYRRALRVDPKRDLYTYLGHIASKQGLLKQAKIYHCKSIKHPDCCVDEACFNLGGIFLAEKDYRQAIKCYRKALKIDPHYGIAKKRLKDAELALLLKNSLRLCRI